MGLRIAILLAVIGGLALVGGIAYFAVPNRRGPRIAVVTAVAGVLIVATLVTVLAPISAVTQAPVSPKLSLYLTGQICEPTFGSTCGARPHALLSLHATDGATRWSAPASVAQGRVNSAFFGAPILVNGIVYAVYRVDGAPGNDPATLLALRGNDGSEIWRAELDSTPLAIQVANGQVYVLLQDHEDVSLLRSFNASSGAPTRQLSLPIFAGFVVTNGLIIGCDTYLYASRSANTAFVAYHAGDGSLAWREALPAATQMGPPQASCVLALGDAVVYQASYTGDSVTAVRIGDGRALWTARVGSVAALALKGDRLIAISAPTTYSKFSQSPPASEKIVALNPDDGRALWQHEFPAAQVYLSYAYPTVAVDEQRVFVATTSALRSLRLSDGEMLWDHKSTADSQVYAYPTIAETTLFVEFGSAGFDPTPARRAALPSHIFALNAATGEPYWNVSVYSTGFAAGEV
jgi:outer membrane protein assembly factor BamB